LNSVGSIYRPQIEINAYLMVGKPTLRNKFEILIPYFIGIAVLGGNAYENYNYQVRNVK